jgi:hypothetical protein
LSASSPSRSRAFSTPALAVALSLAAALASCGGGDDDEVQASAECLDRTSAIFDEKVAPLLASDQPKTCNQCHLSGIDMSLFVRDTMCETRACLYEYGLVDPDNVDDSLVLAWIARAHPDSELITEQVIQGELDGFKAFLSQLTSCSNASCEGTKEATCSTAAKGGSKCARADEPPDVTPTSEELGCSPVAIETAFRDNVYAWRGRCFPCHHSDQTLADKLAPRWLSVEGTCDAGAVQTLRTVIDAGYLNSDTPEDSLLLRKPLALAAGGVEHGGGEKFHDQTDFAYQSFLSFIQYWSSCVNAGAPY